MRELAPEYVAARRVLLDALGALAEHRDNLILVGAQAVYFHTGDADLNVPLMTTDGDLAINTDELADLPEIGRALRDAGFVPGTNPGHWMAPSEIAVDLMVAPHQARTAQIGARAARLSPHERATARIARGLEAALVDNEKVVVSALDAADSRSIEQRIAGPAALLTAKGIKIGERLRQARAQPDRVKAKDTLDAFRILQAIELPDLILGFEKHARDANAAAISGEAIEIYREHASSPEGRIAQLAAIASPGDPTVARSFVALVTPLIDHCRAVLRH